MKIDGEIWRDVPGYGGRYQVSNKGRVMSFVKTRLGRIMRMRDRAGLGYMSVGLVPPAGGQKTHYVHRLVLRAFMGEPPSGKPQAAHFNGVRADNRLENLRWASARENAADKRRHGTMSGLRGEDCPSSKLTDAQAIEIYSSRERCIDLASRFGVSHSSISLIRTGRTWAHVTGASQ